MPDIFSYKGQSLGEWKPAHSALFAIDESNAGVFSDSVGMDWHLIRLAKDEFLFSRLNVSVVFEPVQNDGPYLYLHHFGRKDICKINMNGDVIFRGDDVEIDMQRSGSHITLNVVFDNTHNTVSIGSATDDDIYNGTGLALFRIHAIEINILGQIDAQKFGWPLSERIRLIDVGGAGGLHSNWIAHSDKISPTLFEPNPEEAAKLGNFISRFPGGSVVQKALSNVSETRPLNITEYWGCTSVLEPNFDVLSRYRIGSIFKVKDRQNVECVRYDSLYYANQAPPPDVIKIDVQGFEYQVLLGFGGLLEHCIGVELETHLYPIYRNQKLLGDIVALLDGFGLSLRAVRPVPHFDGDLVEVDAFFTRRKTPSLAADALMTRKLELVNAVWALPSS